MPSFCRVARALPANDDDEGSFFVFRRVKEEVRVGPVTQNLATDTQTVLSPMVHAG